LNKKINIIYAKSTEEIFNRQSALGSYIHCLATILSRNGYNVRVNELPFYVGLKQKNSSSVNRYDTPSLLKKLIPEFVKEVIKDARLFKLLDELIIQFDKGNDFDCILEFYTYGSDLGYQLSKKYNKPLFLIYDNPVLEEHVFFHKKQLLFKSKIEKREKKSILHANGIVAYSNAVKEYLNKKYSKQLPISIHQNVDYTRFDFINEKTEEDVLNIGFIGSFLKWHRVDLLINAFIRLKRDKKDCKLYLAGSGMEFNLIKQKVAASEFSADIYMLGFIDGKELLDFKQKINIGVMPGSNWYGAPNKIFEYGAAKIAVVAPDTPTIVDLFKDNEELLIFKQDDENSLYEQLLRYINDTELRHQHAIALQNKIRNNYSENITFTFYNQLLS
jgi:glycosyltransferase involved in cell wall biosynthesis